MYYRRKIIFGLLENTGGTLERTRLQKLMFLLAQKQQVPSYDFVPYRYGSFSYSLKADLDAMVKRGWLSIEGKAYSLQASKPYFGELKEKDQKVVKQTVDLYGHMNASRITQHTYLNFPYFAINSTIVDKLVPQQKYRDRIEEQRPTDESTKLFTIGYEGISVEEYFNRLIRSNVKLLIDVRRNALSQKYGFSKSTLSSFCRRLNIVYEHIPEVGIDSSKRRSLETQTDYDQLFADYKETVLQNATGGQDRIVELLRQYKRVALTCFEANTCQCHRTPLAEQVVSEFGNPLKLTHI